MSNKGSDGDKPVLLVVPPSDDGAMTTLRRHIERLEREAIQTALLSPEFLKPEPLPEFECSDPMSIREWLAVVAPELLPTKRDAFAVLQMLTHNGRLHAAKYPSVKVGELRGEDDATHPIHMSREHIFAGPEAFAVGWKNLKDNPAFKPENQDSFATPEALTAWIEKELTLETLRRVVFLCPGEWRSNGVPVVFGGHALIIAADGTYPLASVYESFRDAVKPVKEGIFDSLEAFEAWTLTKIEKHARGEV